MPERDLGDEGSDAQPRGQRRPGTEQRPSFVVRDAPQAQAVDEPGSVEAEFFCLSPALRDFREGAGREG